MLLGWVGALLNTKTEGITIILDCDYWGCEDMGCSQCYHDFLSFIVTLQQDHELERMRSRKDQCLYS